MQGDMGDVRLRLSEAARTAFYDYYLARCEMEVNVSTRRLVTQFREIAWNKYQVNQTTQQDALQADVEFASLESRRTELSVTRRSRVLGSIRCCIVRPTILFRRRPPRRPCRIRCRQPSAATDAADSRPDLFALQARIRAEEANSRWLARSIIPT